MLPHVRIFLTISVNPFPGVANSAAANSAYQCRGRQSSLVPYLRIDPEVDPSVFGF